MSISGAMMKVGEAADTIDNLLGALQLPMPAQFHVDQLKAALPKLRDELREAYRADTGEDPWSTHPDEPLHVDGGVGMRESAEG